MSYASLSFVSLGSPAAHLLIFFFSSRRRHTRSFGDWSSDVCSSDLRPLVELYLEPGVFSEPRTEKLPLRVDFIHRLEFGEVSGHRVLIKRGPGNRGPTECGTTHEATSGMSS